MTGKRFKAFYWILNFLVQRAMAVMTIFSLYFIGGAIDNTQPQSGLFEYIHRLRCRRISPRTKTLQEILTDTRQEHKMPSPDL